MTRGKLFLIGLCAYFFALISMLPASFLDVALNSASNGSWRLVEAGGTLWSGTGQVELRDADGHSSMSKEIAWRCLPLSLLRGHMDFELDVAQSPRKFPVTISYSQIVVANADIPLPAPLLGLAMPKLAPMGLGGTVLLHIADIAVRRDGVQGSATLRWYDTSSVLTPIAPLGNYELNLDGEGERIRVSLRTLQGPLLIDGKGSVSSGGDHAFLAIIRVPENLREQLSPALRLIAVERGAGVFELEVSRAN